jgi:aminoglycoside adenylyltransferase-like protein
VVDEGFDDACDTYVTRVASLLHEALRDDLVGVYLHGSAAMSGFRRDHSDIDVIGVARRSLTPDEKRAIGERLSEAALPCPARELEFHLVTEDAAAHPGPAPRWELIVSTADRPAWRDGAGADGDPDLIAHFAMTRARGRAILGAPPDDVFGEVRLPMLMRSLVGDLEWAKENAPVEHAVLNACRCVRLLHEGLYGSKVEAGEWALGRFDHYRDVIDAALRRQRGDTAAALDDERADAFLAEVMPRLTAAAM